MSEQTYPKLDANKLNTYKLFRILVMIGFISSPIIYLIIPGFMQAHPQGAQLLNAAIGLYFILNWFYLDAGVRHYQGNRNGVAICIVLFALFTVPYYLVKSRATVQQRIRSLLVALTVLFAYFMIAGACLHLIGIHG